MTKIKATLAAVVLAAGLGTPLFMQYSENKSLRAQNQALLAQTSQFAALQAENERLSNRVTLAANNTLSDEQQQELNRLRGDVARLRGEANQADQLRREVDRLRTAQRSAPNQNATQQDNFPRETWAFAGYATPESAVQSLAWAALQGDLNTFLGSMSPEKQAKDRERWQKAGENETQVRDNLSKEFGRTKGIRVEGRRAISDNEMILNLFIEQENRNPERVSMKLQRIGNEWKIAGIGGRHDPDFTE